MIGATIRVVFGVLVVGGLLFGGGYRLKDLYSAPLEETKLDETRTEDRELFKALIKYRVVRPRADSGLDVMEPDHFLVRRAEGKDKTLTDAQRADQKEQRRLHGILYFAPVGGLIREQVRLWNETRYVAGIRDNRTRPPGEFTNEWEAFSPKGHPLGVGKLMPESFGFVMDGQLSPGYSDWAVVSREGGTVTFRAKLPARKAAVVSVQVIGKPIAVTPKGARVKNLEGKPQFGCGSAQAAIVTIPIKPGAKATVPVSITVEPSVNCEKRINGLAIRMTRDAVGRFTAFDWRPIKRSIGTASRFVLTTADGIALTDGDGSGKPTQAAYDLGLVPLIGFGPAATLSLAGIMAGANLPPQGVTAALTIDSRLQKATQAAILKQIQKMRRARDADKRKAAVVVLDADTGAILAVASYPNVPAGARPWDYAAFGTAFPLRDPSTVIAWGIIDQNNTPGSTYKPLVALAVMRGANADELPRYRRIISGLTAGEMGPAMGIAPGQAAYAPNGDGGRSISNFGNGGLGPFQSTGRSAFCSKPDAPPTYSTFGLRQGVQYSINVWFARISVMLDEQHIKGIVDDLLKQKNRGLQFIKTPSRLIKTIRELGIDDTKRMDLAINVPPTVKLRRFLAGASADVLYPQVAKQAFLATPVYAVPGAVKSLRHISALNGIGQSVSVHPLHMAHVAAVIASGTRVSPHIFAAWDGTKLAHPKPRDLGVDLQLMTVLRQGMKAVPEAGTARGRFPGDLACRTYGKTGTAEIIKKTGQHSAWFIGWRDPKTPVGQRNKALPKDRRLAFACMVTHGYGGFRTGGSSCAPVISDILQEIERDEKAEEKKKKKKPRRKPRRASRAN